MKTVRYGGKVYEVYREIYFQGVLAGYAVGEALQTEQQVRFCIAINDPLLEQ